jgi:Ca2+-binding EF-hand superfamily protein
MEFEGLYRYIQDWHNIFLRFDRDGSGLIDRKELHQALLGFGFSLPSEMVRKLEKRYAPPPNPGQPAKRGIAFDRFLMACVTVKHYTEAFRRIDANGQGRINVDYNQFVSGAWCSGTVRSAVWRHEAERNEGKRSSAE